MTSTLTPPKPGTVVTLDKTPLSTIMMREAAHEAWLRSTGEMDDLFAAALAAEPAQ